jgi:hypothetical protein
VLSKSRLIDEFLDILEVYMCCTPSGGPYGRNDNNEARCRLHLMVVACV